MPHLYADFIDRVAKPMRYLGGEYQSVVKDGADGEIAARVCLAFPDVYDIGMSHLGTKIIYSLLNRDPRIACERAFAPWLDMEAELRARGLPLVSLETQRRLCEFDVVGISLQYELTFTNMLTLLDLGGIPLRAAERAEDATLVLVGGPTASHPEPVAPFIDAAFIGEAEELLPPLVLAWAAMRREIAAGARTRRDALAELAGRFPLYVPALYATSVDAATGMTVVGEPLDARAPSRIGRAMVADLERFPFPSDAPVPYAEAVFERASVEIARGCTEGCRFCQAGMIYRPVRERSPSSIADSLIGGVDRAGYDETGLTCLSTADFSSITPLVKQLAGELRKRGVSMSVASLRAYGLNEDLLDELALTRISGLTFAPEAGTQRMRDVVNKNVTEAHIEESSRRVFSRGWHRLKLYFMIGLPTEEDSDVRGIVETGWRMLQIGRGLVSHRAEVTVSVSSHVPKPHTPLQWCAQDLEPEIRRKQAILRDAASAPPPRPGDDPAASAGWSGRRRGKPTGLRLKHHHSGISFVEGVLARGDRRLADVIETVWRAGARFDGWDEIFELERWTAALDAHGVDVSAYLGTRPITARLPWDHIDVGLEDGFLLGEYRKALKGRASPPCGKVAGMLLHHTNLADAEPDRRKLVCYDCGVACDLSKMRDDRLVALRTLGAEKPIPRAGIAIADIDNGRPLVDVSERGGGSPAEHIDDPDDRDDRGARTATRDRETERAERVRLAGHVGAGARYSTYRIRFAKVGRAAFLGHLDLMRLLARSFRRADLPLAQTRGYSPKPRITFGPALGLGVPSLGEIMDVDLEHTVSGCRSWELGDGPRVELAPDEVRERLAAVCPPGIEIESCAIVRLAGHPRAMAAPDLGLGKLIDAVDLVIQPAPDGIAHDSARLERLVAALLARPTAVIARGDKQVDVRALVLAADVIAGDAATKLCAALDWASHPLVRVRVRATAEGSAKPSEVAKALGVWGSDDPRAQHALLARLSVVSTATPDLWGARPPVGDADRSEPAQVMDSQTS
ncbi:MAG TPA: TIGR03960 family B12-binding radical SAM protein [Kofleriaceae bacterium]|nr:TIGR03960 family B12-binding radical SAM protein [Kofleriaceae bacterium]